MTKINIDDLTLGEIKQLTNLFNKGSISESTGLNNHIGKKVIVRTYSAGVFYGELVEKVGGEAILKDARRLYYWKTTDGGLSLSEVANTGLHKDSKVCAPTDLHWLQPIEIITCSKESIKSIESKANYTA